ncbi:hypothetical protein [Streptomyces tsukubensis]|uniref:hypothetical protein n=1 Tax=Streptomyces tsukubensis TaxID=83656 RepID=UPI0011801882|nr:hypothetical protein [Streptomyces tsukubensis]QFR91976.1 hypothetical protein GBW32_01580 [Streptomyces tsukubensis]
MSQGDGELLAEALGEPEADAGEESNGDAGADGVAETEGAAAPVSVSFSAPVAGGAVLPVAEPDVDVDGGVGDPPSAWAVVAVRSAAGTKAAAVATADIA